MATTKEVTKDVKEVKEITVLIDPRANNTERQAWFCRDGVDYYVAISEITGDVITFGNKLSLSDNPYLVRMIQLGDYPHSFRVDGEVVSDDVALDTALANTKK